MPSMENINLFLESSKPTDLLRKVLVRHVPFSGMLLEHGFLKAGLPANVQANLIESELNRISIFRSKILLQARKEQKC